MKIFIDGFGVVAHAITRKILENHKVRPVDILVNTYDTAENAVYIEFLRRTKISFQFASYSDSSVLKMIKKFSPDIVMSLYGRRIIPQNILDLAKYGNFNLHPSLLPHYKGCFSGVWAIINKETQTGITIHEMIKDVDAGDILYQEKLLIDKAETGYSIWHKTASRFVEVFDSFFSRYLAGDIERVVMPEGGSYFPRCLPNRGHLDESWGEDRVEAFIRAMYFPPYPGAVLEKAGIRIEIESMEQFRRASEL